MRERKIFTSYFGKYREVSAEYQCISIANTKPSTMCIPEWKEVAPPWDIIKAIKEGKISGKQFAKEYYSVLNERAPYYYKGYLLKYKLPIALLCWEENALSCHRYLLAAYLSYICKIDVIEYSSYVTTMPKDVFYRLLEGE